MRNGPHAASRHLLAAVKKASAPAWVLCQAGSVQTRFCSPAFGSCRIGWSASLRTFCGPVALGVDSSVDGPGDADAGAPAPPGSCEGMSWDDGVSR